MKALEPKIQSVHNTYWSNEQEAARGKTVVLVEGDDDRDVLDPIFRERSPTWETRIRIVVAGGRSHVLARLKSTFPHALGLVDRDTWDDNEFALHQAETSNRLFATEGWCIENIFLNPSWLETYDRQIAARVASERERWVRAGALWWTLQRTREAQQKWQDQLGWSYGSPRDDLDLASPQNLVIDSLSRRIPEEVQRAARFDLEAVAETFVKRRDEILALPEATQWQIGVHGKRAFNELLVPALQAVRGQQNWRVELARSIGRPAPLDALIAVLLP
jgi:hypothetical protein